LEGSHDYTQEKNTEGEGQSLQQRNVAGAHRRYHGIGSNHKKKNQGERVRKKEGGGGGRRKEKKWGWPCGRVVSLAKGSKKKTFRGGKDSGEKKKGKWEREKLRMKDTGTMISGKHPRSVENDLGRGEQQIEERQGRRTMVGDQVRGSTNISQKLKTLNEKKAAIL